ncbi:eukaryotic translation initiation factor 2C, 2 [Linnemannia gamsii]|uniref:Eukaryotic translation initiation factor 2C, 2 n=1 Tax=Linnemannia gamsii TaxID=64522 RepID=A0ABQ7KFU0_9FUNG|nr:eukaryotic translation initiation factor 2C, 2 [Linnemannia gamsii]
MSSDRRMRSPREDEEMLDVDSHISKRSRNIAYDHNQPHPPYSEQPRNLSNPSPLAARVKVEPGTAPPPPAAAATTTPTKEPQTGCTKRPDQGGRTGRQITINTNFFPLSLRPTYKTIHHYHIDISPEVPPRRNRELWQELQRHPIMMETGTLVAYDGRHSVFSPKQLPAVHDNNGAVTIKIELAGQKQEIAFKIMHVNEIDMEALAIFLKTGKYTQDCTEAIQALNVALTHKPYSNMVTVGRSVFTPDGAQDLRGGIEMWHGIYHTVRLGQQQLFVNVDKSAGAFVKGGSAIELMKSIAPRWNPSHPLDRRDKDAIEMVIKGLFFKVTHRGKQFRRKYKMTQLSRSGADDTFFDHTTNDGGTRKVSVEQYYQHAYTAKLHYPRAPCFGVPGRNNTVAYFPAELCYFESGQSYKKKLNDEQVAAMLRAASMKPEPRIQKIKQSIQTLDFKNNPFLAAFGMSISDRMSDVPARVLQAPRIEFARGVKAVPRQGTWELNASQQYLGTATLHSWGLLVFENEGRLQRYKVESFVRRLVQVLSTAGMNVVMMEPPIGYTQPQGSIDKEIGLARRRIENVCQARIQMLIALLPGKGLMYPDIKAFCETSESGIMTQCALTSKIEKANDAYCRLLGMKILSKLGGTVNRLEENSLGSPGEIDRPSIASVVALVDDCGFRHIGRIQRQPSQGVGAVEVIEGLPALMMDLIASYKQIMKHHPQRILFYRDGVSESQFPEILRTEVKAIKIACHQIDPKYKPAVTFVVVKKRHNTRFFPMDKRDSDRSGNCESGTVVDSMITHPIEFDFYLQSHAGLQGTSRCAHYCVLYDENKFTSDDLQQLTFNLCHVYSRCSKATSIVPAVQYAHLLAYRARCYRDVGVNTDRPEAMPISNELKNTMFFV